MACKRAGATTNPDEASVTGGSEGAPAPRRVSSAGEVDPEEDAVWIDAWKYLTFDTTFRCAVGGDELACAHVGVRYRDGDGVQKSDKEAVRWFIRALECSSQYTHAQNAFAVLNGLAENGNAPEWVTKAAVKLAQVHYQWYKNSLQFASAFSGNKEFVIAVMWCEKEDDAASGDAAYNFASKELKLDVDVQLVYNGVDVPSTEDVKKGLLSNTKSCRSIAESLLALNLLHIWLGLDQDDEDDRYRVALVVTAMLGAALSLVFAIGSFFFDALIEGAGETNVKYVKKSAGLLNAKWLVVAAAIFTQASVYLRVVVSFGPASAESETAAITMTGVILAILNTVLLLQFMLYTSVDKRIRSAEKKPLPQEFEDIFGPRERTEDVVTHTHARVADPLVKYV
jgi:hypothetical protein